MKVILILFLSCSALADVQTISASGQTAATGSVLPPQALDPLEQELAKADREKKIEDLKERIIVKCDGAARTIKEQKSCITNKFKALKLSPPVFIK